MSLDELLLHNPNPSHLVALLLDPLHSNCYKEMRYHNPTLVAKFLELDNDVAKCTAHYRTLTAKTAISRVAATAKANNLEQAMEARLRVDPMDAEANKFFGEKIRLKNVNEQYELMMEQYPEAQGRVLMLYIGCEVNKCAFPAFVDSGAQMTIMSEAFADKLDLLHLVDTRFAGMAVGVGTGKILGKIHLASIKVTGSDGSTSVLPMTVTVMAGGGMGDSNMDFLLGLDMLKRHRCNINLATNALDFTLDGRIVSTPFLQEWQLDQSKGGTKGFDANKNNEELEQRMMEAEKRAEEGGGGGGDGGDDEIRDDKMQDDGGESGGGGDGDGDGDGGGGKSA
jgi:DNA damage-inducible protein 1